MSDEIIHIYNDFEQNTALWDHVRLGIPTASEFAMVMRQGKVTAANITRRRYLDRIADELITGLPTETYRNAFMARGHAQQQEALEAYCHARVADDVRVEKVAFIRNSKLLCGCSPDALIGDDGGVEVKTLIGHEMVNLRLHPDIPLKHLPQLYGNMLVTGRKHWDICIYSRGHPPFIRRLVEDADYLRQLRLGIKQFNIEVDAIILELEGKTALTLRERLDVRLSELREEERDKLTEGDCNAG